MYSVSIQSHVKQRSPSIVPACPVFVELVILQCKITFQRWNLIDQPEVHGTLGRCIRIIIEYNGLMTHLVGLGGRLHLSVLDFMQ